MINPLNGMWFCLCAHLSWPINTNQRNTLCVSHKVFMSRLFGNSRVHREVRFLSALLLPFMWSRFGNNMETRFRQFSHLFVVFDYACRGGLFLCLIWTSFGQLPLLLFGLSSEPANEPEFHAILVDWTLKEDTAAASHYYQYHYLMLLIYDVVLGWVQVLAAEFPAMIFIFIVLMLVGCVI